MRAYSQEKRSFQKESHVFIKFLIVGVMNTVIGLGSSYILLDGFHVTYWAATFLGNAAGAAFSYFANRRLTFQSHSPIGRSIVLFMIVILICYFFSYSVGLKLADGILSSFSWIPRHYAHDVAVLFGATLYTITNYVGQRFIVFSTLQKDQRENG